MSHYIGVFLHAKLSYNSQTTTTATKNNHNELTITKPYFVFRQGGIPGKLKGRVSDASLVGCGGYASKFGAAATNGPGESIMKMTLAKEVVNNMESGQNAQVSF